jgi:peptidoglycan/LPS O-acetylase OafA/YrhL
VVGCEHAKVQTSPVLLTSRQRSEVSFVEQAGYRPDIDGLRAIAVGLVVLQHGDLLFSGGYIGVDVFFVISGFLITRLILAACNAQNFTLKGFWLRRARRILPAAAVAVAATLALGFVLLPPQELATLASSTVAQQLLVGNFYFWQHSGYFDVPSRSNPLLHTWSLAVEEQFYLVWPLLLMFLYRRSRRALVGGSVLLAVGSFALCVAVTSIDPRPAFYLMPTRMWELLLGALINWLPRTLLCLLESSCVSGIIGLALIIASAASYTATTPFPGSAALVPCLGAFLIIAAPSKRLASATSLLSAPLLVYLGRASYSIYLWHWPVGVFVKAILGEEPSLFVRGLVAIMSVVLGCISYEMIEMPVRRRSWLKENREFVKACILSTAAICIAGLAVERYVVLRYPAVTGLHGKLAVDIQVASPEEETALGKHPRSIYVHVLGDLSDPHRAPSFVLWGDSHADMLAPLCHTLAVSRGIWGACFARGGVPPLLGVWCQNPQIEGKAAQLGWNEEVVAWIKQHQVRDVVMAARWDLKVPPTQVEVGPNYDAGLLRDEQSVEMSQADAQRAWEEGLHQTMSVFEAMGTRVWFVRQVPVQQTDLFGRLKLSSATGVTRREYELQQQAVNRALQTCSSPMLSVIGPGNHWFDRDGRSWLSMGNNALYQDGDHLTREGTEKLLRPLLGPVFDAIRERAK